MRRKLATLLRQLAEWISPTPPVKPTVVDLLMPVARAQVRALEPLPLSGATKWLMALKAIEGQMKARRRHINAAIDRAVLELDGDRHGS